MTHSQKYILAAIAGTLLGILYMAAVIALS